NSVSLATGAERKAALNIWKVTPADAMLTPWSSRSSPPVRLEAMTRNDSRRLSATSWNSTAPLLLGPRWTPAAVSGLSGVAAIAVGAFHGLALKSDGTVWTWGYNNEGELGDGTTTQRLTPVPVSGLTGVVAIAAGYAHSVALK